MQYIIKELEEHELGRAVDVRSAWDLVEAEWPGAVVVGQGGTIAQGRMNLSILLQANMSATIVVGGRAVGSVEVEERENE